MGRVLCFVWREKDFISIQHEKKKFALGHKEAIVQFLIYLGEKGDEGEKKAFLSARKAIVLLLISLGDKSDKGEKKKLFVYTNLEFRFLKFYSYLV